MFIHRHPRHHLARLLSASLRVTVLFALPFAAAALLGGPAAPSGSTPPAALANEGAQVTQVAHVAGQQPATPRAAH